MNPIETPVVASEPAVPFINISKATKQEVYDWAVLSILTQGIASTQRKEKVKLCAYESTTKDGGFVRCVAGQLLTKIQLEIIRRENLLAEDWGSLVSENIVPKKHEDLICDLQEAHDAASDTKKDFIGEFIKDAERVAKEHNVKTDVLLFAKNDVQDAESQNALFLLQSIGVQP